MKRLSDAEKAKLRAKIAESQKERINRIVELAEEEEQKWPSFSSSRCPRCGRKGALVRTGRTKKKGYWWNSRMYNEYQCKHCQYSQWRRRVDYN